MLLKSPWEVSVLTRFLLMGRTETRAAEEHSTEENRHQLSCQEISIKRDDIKTQFLRFPRVVMLQLLPTGQWTH